MCKMIVIWNKYKIIRLLIVVEILYVKLFNRKEILEVWDEKYIGICNWMR